MKKKRVILIIVCAVCILAGLCALLYPAFASWYSKKVQSSIISEYDDAIKDAKTEDIERILREARQYNRKLAEGRISVYDVEKGGYFAQLSCGGSGIMGYIEIPKINVDLPIYHGITGDEMQRGAGHVPQTSLPIGGIDTHSAIAAHTGQASDPLFSDLPLLEIGDGFSIHIFGDVLNYKIIDKQVVVPTDVETIKIQKGKDLVTLITCYPYPSNTERLLVTGERQPETQEETMPTETCAEETESLLVRNCLYGAALGLGVTVILAAAVWIISSIRKHHEKEE